MDWIPVIAWGVALVLALVVLGFCAFEIVWKANRLRSDLAGLQALQDQLDELRNDATAASIRLTDLAARGLH
ncbi:MAG TPA: hypothetical protein VJ831_12810 [Jatrophihabitantaceae bacterium]|nr:hypothetical protein [Jatrophihabitantaceae bacterium]